jgi:hypothetical protein
MEAGDVPDAVLDIDKATNATTTARNAIARQTVRGRGGLRA